MCMFVTCFEMKAGELTVVDKHIVEVLGSLSWGLSLACTLDEGQGGQTRSPLVPNKLPWLLPHKGRMPGRGRTQVWITALQVPDRRRSEGMWGERPLPSHFRHDWRQRDGSVCVCPALKVTLNCIKDLRHFVCQEQCVLLTHYSLFTVITVSGWIKEMISDTTFISRMMCHNTVNLELWCVICHDITYVWYPDVHKCTVINWHHHDYSSQHTFADVWETFKEQTSVM